MANREPPAGGATSTAGQEERVNLLKLLSPSHDTDVADFLNKVALDTNLLGSLQGALAKTLRRDDAGKVHRSGFSVTK